jgi:hypothetical protein
MKLQAWWRSRGIDGAGAVRLVRDSLDVIDDCLGPVAWLSKAYSLAAARRRPLDRSEAGLAQAVGRKKREVIAGTVVPWTFAWWAEGGAASEITFMIGGEGPFAPRNNVLVRLADGFAANDGETAVRLVSSLAEVLRPDAASLFQEDSRETAVASGLDFVPGWATYLSATSQVVLPRGVDIRPAPGGRLVVADVPLRDFDLAAADRMTRAFTGQRRHGR